MSDFSIDWKDIPPAERKQLTILWYFGRGNSTGCCINEGNLSQGDTCSPNINNINRLAEPESTYTLSYFIVASSDGDVSYREIKYDDEGPGGYYDRLSWLLTPAINSCEKPYQTTEVKKGERWQTIMGRGSCTIITGKDLDTESIENPTGSISITNITNPDGTSPGPGPGPGPGPSPGGNCYYETCCDPAEYSYYYAVCRARRAEIAADGGICCGGQSPTGPQGPLGPFVPTSPNFSQQ